MIRAAGRTRQPWTIANKANLYQIPIINCRQAEKALSRHLDGELPESQVDALEQHMSDCAACRETAAEWRGFGENLRADAAALMTGCLRDQVGGRRESVKTKPSGRSRHDQRAVANESGTQERLRARIG